jgi:multiple sugar transport system permease protein
MSVRSSATPVTQSSVLSPQPSRRNRQRRREAIEGYLFVAPAVIGFLLFTFFPMIASFALSFTEYNLLSSPEWIGFDNYVAMAKDEFFWRSLRITATYAVVGLPLGLLLGLLVALLLNQQVPGISIWRSLYVLPSVLSGAAVVVLWRWLLNPEFGLLTVMLGYLGIKGPDWLGSTAWALPSLILISLWGFGGSMLVYLAGLQGIPQELYEAVEVDGGSAWDKFRTVTIPMLSPVILFNLVIGLIAAFQFFTEPFGLTEGGPENSTLVYMLYLYRNAYLYLDMGYASAMAWVLFLLVLLLTLLVFRSTPMWVHYESERGRR